MATLARELRKELERTVKQARRAAEAGARKAVEQLGVGDGDAPRHLSAEQRRLRNRLRAHGRQLGDRRDERRATQATERLIQECAYEHWHRMLFARFLAEADLLIEPDSGVAITLEEVQELARDKARDWLELASEYAERMLPQIFRKGDPVLDVNLPPENRSELEDLLKKLPRDIFLADDGLGWVYQFWQAERKEEINKSEKKIGADELPAVTQLFTEDYMVLFLLHNTLGAWWAGKILANRPELAALSKDEDELRAACKVGDIEWTYLRFVREPREDGAEGPWCPAAGTFEGWPKAAKDITVLDPCMGSGHFLVFALPILVAFRMAEEKLSRDEAIDVVLADNLFGLEIDQRCTQIAAFNLALVAWRSVGYRALPRLNLACSGFAIGVTKGEWLKLAERAAQLADPGAKRDIFGLEKNLVTPGISERAKRGLERLYDLFSKAPWLGSLINPRRVGGDLLIADFTQLEPLLAPILSAAGGDDVTEMVVAAQGMAKAGEILAQGFTLVTTNVPYLGRGKQDDEVKAFCERDHSDAKADVALCMLERCVDFAAPGASVVVVTPQNWLFLHSYKKLRSKLLKSITWRILAKLGANAFQDMNWWAAITLLAIFENAKPTPKAKIYGVDVGHTKDQEQKAFLMAGQQIVDTQQSAQLKNPDNSVIFDDLSSKVLLRDVARSVEGLSTGDGDRYLRKFWELPTIDGGWSFYHTTSDQTEEYGGLSEIVFWESGEGELSRSDAARIQGQAAWGKCGVLVSKMNKLKCNLYFGLIHDKMSAAIIPNNPEDIPLIWTYCSSDEYYLAVRKISQKVDVATNTLIHVAFDRADWQGRARECYPSGLPVPYANNPTSFLFSGYPGNEEHSIHVAAARLLGYRWPRQEGAKFPHCPNLDNDELDDFVKDDLICLTAIKGEAPAEHRLTLLLGKAFGLSWSSGKLGGLLAEVGFAGKSLDNWLRDEFFQQHCELFHHRPFIWHIWDGRRDGFHVLVNYHKLAAPGGEGRRTLERLIYTYLGDWIDRQRADQKAGVEGADGRVAAAEHLRNELIKILEGEPPYDIFVRWKPLHEQPIGWEPDINDGVRINIRPFMTARPLGASAKNACILRNKPNIKWDKDRGKEPARDKDEYPWFYGWRPDEPNLAVDFAGGAEFDGARWNNLHYTRAVKQAARERKQK